MDNVTRQPQSKLLDSRIYTGVVQISFPNWGWCLVIPGGTNSSDYPVICHINCNGGTHGGVISAAPATGSLVTYRRQAGTDKGYIISASPQGNQYHPAFEPSRFRHHVQVPAQGELQFCKTLVQDIQDTVNRGKERAVFTGIPEDVYEGDIYIGDKYGPCVLGGRAQITVKGSQNCYFEMSSLQDKMTAVTSKAEFFTAADCISITPSLSKILKASGVLQGLGGRCWDSDKPLQMVTSDPDSLYYTEKYEPAFRFQTFSGGAARGYHRNIISLKKSAPSVTPVISTEIDSINGSRLNMFQGFTNIKTTQTTGIVDNPFQAAEGTQDRDVEFQIRHKNAKNSIDEFKKVKLSDNGLQKIAQISKIFYDKYTKALVSHMLGHEVMQLISGQVQPFPDEYSNYLEWGSEKPTIQGDFISDYPTAQDLDDFTGLTQKRFKNNSIITQDPDGTITLKDGWGSQITLSHGNIYISSALDTFIRPGRSLINIVPEHCTVTANGEIQLVSSKHIRVGAEGNLMLASAIGGKKGYTTLQNRSREAGKNNGIVVRSNGNLTLTASDDLHIGINDKRTQNKRNAANYSNGTIFIQGGAVRVESRGELRLVGAQTGLYACSTSSGTGIQLSVSGMCFVSPFVDMDTSSLRIGGFSTTYSLKTGATGQNTVRLNKGGSTALVHIRGNMQCKQLLCGRTATVRGMFAAGDYVILQTTPLQYISGVQAKFLKKLRARIDRRFNSKLTSFALSFIKKFQDWYDDNFICRKQLTLKDNWKASKMPSMCWQLTSQVEGNFNSLKQITVKATGQDAGETCSYPGKANWQGGCKMSSLQEGTYKVNYDTPIAKGYKTHSEGE